MKVYELVSTCWNDANNGKKGIKPIKLDTDNGATNRAIKPFDEFSEDEKNAVVVGWCYLLPVDKETEKRLGLSGAYMRIII